MIFVLNFYIHCFCSAELLCYLSQIPCGRWSYHLTTCHPNLVAFVYAEHVLQIDMPKRVSVLVLRQAFGVCSRTLSINGYGNSKWYK